MEWLIYHLMWNVVTHYWYGIQCNVFLAHFKPQTREYFLFNNYMSERNPKCTCIDMYGQRHIRVCRISVQQTKVSTRQSLDSKWAQCDYLAAHDCTIYEHTMKASRCPTLRLKMVSYWQRLGHSTVLIISFPCLNVRQCSSMLDSMKIAKNKLRWSKWQWRTWICESRGWKLWHH